VLLSLEGPDGAARAPGAGERLPEARATKEAAMDRREIREEVRAKYARAALRVQEAGGGCCGPSADCGSNPVTSNLYAAAETAAAPVEAAQASLGCGNPVALAALAPGEVVLDLGSGGGLDVILSARRVGPAGRVYGLDMTDEMLALARENQARAGVTNVEFLKGEIERIPLPDASVDVVISNCVINLSGDKPRVLEEAFRVLRPGGRFAVHDIVTDGPVAPAIRESVGAWTGCIAGALEEGEYRRLLAAAGFEGIDVEPTRVYRAEDARRLLESQPDLLAALRRAGGSLDDLLAAADGKYRAAFVRAVKPAARPPAPFPRIAAARPADLPAVLGLLAGAGLPGDGVAEHFAHFLVARDGAEIVGAVGLEPHGTSVLLRSLVVAPAWRKRGLGLALAHQLLGAARAREAARVYLLTETAAPFFERMGFARIARETVDPRVRASGQFGGGCCQTAACLVLDL
jgi:N-acetylglutamate synthase-like GNAT family acetyltransferase/SAM-dependent methyltransferase